MSPWVLFLSAQEDEAREVLAGLNRQGSFSFVLRSPSYFRHYLSVPHLPSVVFLDVEALDVSLVQEIVFSWGEVQPEIPLILIVRLGGGGYANSLELFMKGAWDLIVKPVKEDFSMIRSLGFANPTYGQDILNKARKYIKMTSRSSSLGMEADSSQPSPSPAESVLEKERGEKTDVIEPSLFKGRAPSATRPVAYAFLGEGEGLGPMLHALKEQVACTVVPFFVKTSLPLSFLSQSISFLEKALGRSCMIVPPVVGTCPGTIYLYGADATHPAPYVSGGVPSHLEGEAFFRNLSIRFGGAVRCYIFSGEGFSSLVTAREIVSKGADIVIKEGVYDSGTLPALLVKAGLHMGSGKSF